MIQFHVNAESMIVRTREMPIISANMFDFTGTKILSLGKVDIYRSHAKLLRYM